MDPNFEQAQEDLRKEEKKLGVSIATLHHLNSFPKTGHHQKTREDPLRRLPLTAELGGEPANRTQDEES